MFDGTDVLFNETTYSRFNASGGPRIYQDLHAFRIRRFTDCCGVGGAALVAVRGDVAIRLVNVKCGVCACAGVEWGELVDSEHGECFHHKKRNIIDCRPWF
jgi:hypothetical protein